MEHLAGDRPTQVIAKRVRQARARHGLTAQQLAEKLTTAGVPWTRATVTKVETGRRESITVTELLALARVLDVAPLHLLVPVDGRPYDDERRYLVTPNEAQPVYRVREWIRGETPLSDTDTRVFRTEVPENELRETPRRAPDWLTERRLYEASGYDVIEEPDGTLRARHRDTGEVKTITPRGGEHDGEHREAP